MSTHKPVDWTKELQTKDGHKARLLGVLKTEAAYNHVVAVMADCGTEWHSVFDASGRFMIAGASPNDLINPPARIKREVWVNVYSGSCDIIMHPTREKADCWGDTDRIACVKVTIDCAEGEGL